VIFHALFFLEDCKLTLPLLVIVPTGTVTYHRQVIKKPVYLKAGQDAGEHNGFRFHKVNADSVTPLEEAPQGALQLDFANKNIGGGALDRVSIYCCC